MTEPERILGEPLWRELCATYREWVRRDRFRGTGPREADDDDPGRLIAQFIGGLLQAHAHGELYPRVAQATCDLKSTFNELLACDIVLRRHNVLTMVEARQLALTHFGFMVLPELLLEVFITEGSAAGFARRDALFASARCADWRELEDWVSTEAHCRVIAEGLLQLLLRDVGHRTLESFFGVERGELGYRTSVHRMFTGHGAALPVREYAASAGTVRVRVVRYLDASDADIRAYEWHAALWTPTDKDVPSAAACGMVYVLPREEGLCAASPADLKFASDTMADADFLQVLAFLTQCPDAEDCMDAGDLCFVWLWERRGDAPSGLGAELLNLTAKDLKKRFPKLAVLVANAQPAQFPAGAIELEPPAIQVQRQEATERLEQLLETTAAHRRLNGRLRVISMRERISRAELCAVMYD